MIRLRTKSVDDTRALAAELASVVDRGDIVVLAGDLGSGKTAFAQGFARGLGVGARVTSPTFTLVRTYDEGRLPLVHLDVYRLDHMQELVELGLAELLEDAVALIEWGDVVEPVLPADLLEVLLEGGEDEDERLLRLRPVGARWSNRMAAVAETCGRWQC